jgi:hypothetical protein
MTKKKVSFDIDQKLLTDIKSLCKIKDIKLADFFRDASLRKLENEEIYMTILVPTNGKIEKFTVEKRNYEIDIFEASQEMKINVDAKCEGVIRMKDAAGESRIDKMIMESQDKKIAFYTTEKYC